MIGEQLLGGFEKNHSIQDLVGVRIAEYAKYCSCYYVYFVDCFVLEEVNSGDWNDIATALADRLTSQIRPLCYDYGRSRDGCLL